MFENARRGRQARNFATNVPKILDLKSSTEQVFSENWRLVPLFIILWPRERFIPIHFSLRLIKWNVSCFSWKPPWPLTWWFLLFKFSSHIFSCLKKLAYPEWRFENKTHSRDSQAREWTVDRLEGVWTGFTMMKSQEG